MQSQGAWEDYKTWLEDPNEPLAPQPTHPTLVEYKARRPQIFRKLGIIFSASRSNDKVISEEDWHRAKTSLLEVEKTMHIPFRRFTYSQDAINIADMLDFLQLRKTQGHESVPIMALKKEIMSYIDLTKIDRTLDMMQKVNLISIANNKVTFLKHIDGD